MRRDSCIREGPRCTYERVARFMRHASDAGRVHAHNGATFQSALITYIALLRAVNVGGTGKLPMTDLKAMCEDAGFTDVTDLHRERQCRVHGAKASAAKVKSDAGDAPRGPCGKACGCRRADARRIGGRAEGANREATFPKAAQNRAVAIFLDAPPPNDALKQTAGQHKEEMRLGAREIFVHYPDGIGVSKLRIPAAKSGTARNMNTVAKLVEIAELL